MHEKFWEEIETLLGGRTLRPEGEGWFTVGEFAEKFGISPSAAAQRLKRIFTKGKVEKARLVLNGPLYYKVKNG